LYVQRRLVLSRGTLGLAGLGSGLISGLGGCASWVAPQSRVMSEALAHGASPEFAAVVELDHVPFFPQTPYHCGPAALATVLSHIGVAVQPEALAASVFLPVREGSLQVEMLAAPRSHLALGTRIPGELRGLHRELRTGHPVVVLLNLGLSWQPLWHYAVVVGVNLPQAEIVLRSGSTRREVMQTATFELTWARSGHWAFVVTRPGRWPATSTQAQIEESAVGYERVAKPASALTVYASLLQRWPESLVGMMGQGNAQLILNDLQAAAQSFERAAARHDHAAAWNNLAITRARAGDKPGAMAAAARALDRARRAEPSLEAAVLDTQSSLARGETP
jgi:hypothetical protein